MQQPNGDVPTATMPSGQFTPETNDSESAPGTDISDFLPIPAVNPSETVGPQKPQPAEGLHDKPTLSHALAVEDKDNSENPTGLVQLDHNAEEVRDLGWNEPKQEIPAPLVGGMDNEELWLLVRRFNNTIYHTKATPYPQPGGLDLNTADEEEFSPDKMRANAERAYMTIGVSLLAFVKHIARLRSWRETRRTAYFAGAYFLAWLLDLLMPLLISVLIALIAVPKFRAILFPPAPTSLVDPKTGGIQKPKAGVLGSHDSATGAPENHKGEAVEQEASNFVSGIATVAVSGAVGQHAAGDQRSAEQSTTEMHKAIGNKPGTKHDKTEVPMQTAMWSKMQPIMHTMGDVVDTWERFANALDPTPPFPREVHRLRLVALVLPLLGMSLFVTSYVFVKGLTFGVGLGFFGDPLITPALDWLNRTIPDWKKLLELRNTVLKGVPTNAQLTLTLLRLGEANHAPLPPPPRVNEPPPDKPAHLTTEHLRATGDDAPLNASAGELNDAIQYDPSTKHQSTGYDSVMVDGPDKTQHKKSQKILGFFRGIARGTVKTAVGADNLRAKVGSHHAKDRLGAVPPSDKLPISGPVEFEARYDGKKGNVYLSTAATVPVVAFGLKEPSKEKIGGEVKEDLHPLWSVPVADIVELKKIGGYGWKAKLVVGWSLERDVTDGLEITTHDGKTYKIMAVPLRDELFNRLIAMGGQKWESW
ncbi:hypothetical protein QBC35DRAFT_533470 [Podospora australis]|uniref:Uncharacterized protein n=1 Tax=Podospora australis TaxID=1536484 RepID=A0AAN6WQG7_9PEZI|nr:hypothetical protein QBC35DRAFT_533470 [Podospora australis]